ncbi:MAG: HAMP domain-containing histidine kinase [Clostridia bacterium]|nr:HAMP domain-containing histidine kinase [Clostridia bacterium]
MKTKKRKLSLKWRFFAAFCAVSAVILLLLWLCQTVFLNSFYRTVKVYETKKAAQSVADRLYDEDIEYTIASLSTRYDINIRVVDADFQTVYNGADKQTRSLFNNIPESELTYFYEKASQNGGSYTEYFDGFRLEGSNDTASKADKKTRPEMTSFLAVHLVSDNAGGYYTVLVNTTITPVDSVITTLRVILIVVTAVTVLGSLLAAFLLSARLSKPIKRIGEKAKVLATGDYSVEFEPTGVTELDELSDSLNYAKTELGKMDNLQKELVANISHDLRTPLTLISGYAEVMRDLPGEVTDENLQVIIDESTRMSDLVNDVLDISKLSAGVQQVNKESVDLVQCIQSIIPRYNKLIEQKNYKLLFESAAAAAPVLADRNMLSRVIYNLINNAVTYTGEDKTVRITLTEQGGDYTVHIIDSGEGIPEDKLPYIWDRYYKVDKNHRRAQAGSGLGLSIVKQILDAHDAAYGVTSTPGKGSDFWFSLKKDNT